MQNVYIEDEEFKVKENENKCFIEDEKQADISELEVGQIKLMMEFLNMKFKIN